MHVLGRWNWWAPKPLCWLHDRFGVSEGSDGAILPATADRSTGRHRREDVDPTVSVGGRAARTAATVSDNG
jgi:RND superfamily putative drug exporter